MRERLEVVVEDEGDSVFKAPLIPPDRHLARLEAAGAKRLAASIFTFSATISN